MGEDTRNFVSQLGAIRIIRYLYGGLIFIMFAALLKQELVSQFVKNITPFFSFVLIAVVGIGIYIVHRHVLREIFIFPVVRRIHLLIDKKICKKQNIVDENFTTDCFKYLHILGVPYESRLEAYTYLRINFFDKKIQETLDLTHCELHMFWITAEVSFFYVIYMIWGKDHLYLSRKFFFWVCVALATGLIFCGIYADIKQHMIECHLLKTAFADGTLEPILKKNRFIHLTNESSHIEKQVISEANEAKQQVASSETSKSCNPS